MQDRSGNDELAAWLEESKAVQRMAVLYRVALRALPKELSAAGLEPVPGLAVLRGFLTAGVAAYDRDREIRQAVSRVSARCPEEPGLARALTKVGAAMREITLFGASVHRADVNAVLRIASDLQADASAMALSDISRLETDTPASLFGQRLFASSEDIRQQRLPNPVEKSGNRAPHWAFWDRWYEGFLTGNPLDWDLQREIALIPDEDWEKGPEHIGEEITKIAARFELQARIAELEAERDARLGERHGIGGNLPPEPIEDPPGAEAASEVVERIVLVWEAVDTLKEEAENDAPNRTRFEAAMSAIGQALAAIAKWTAGKLDLSVDTLIKWGIPAGCGYLVLYPEKLRAVYEAAKAFAGAFF